MDERFNADGLVLSENYASTMENAVLPFLKKREKVHTVQGEAGRPLFCVSYDADAPMGTVLVLHGFTECAEKFSELMYSLLQNGFSVVAYDQRGHGFSWRDKATKDDISLTHVSDFNEYEKDLLGVCNAVLKKMPKPWMIFAHSMGGAVTSLFLERHPDVFSRAALCAPMIAANLGSIPGPAVNIMCRFFKVFGMGSKRVFISKPYDGPEKFDAGFATSRERFDWFDKVKNENKKYWNNGPSYSWTLEAIKVTKQLLKPGAPEKIACPVRLYTAEKDACVYPDPQKAFIGRVKQGEWAFVKGSKHEIYRSADDVLFPWWHDVLAFLSGMTKAIQPSEKQLQFMDWEFGAFFHFGIRSFFPGYKDWDNQPMPASAFNPDQLDCGQWIRTVKEAGAAYAILVCKHHDGFANWPTNHSRYSVASAPWKNGRGDVVREFVNACREYGIKVGLYYSPAQWGGEVSFGDAKSYDDYFIGQIRELLTNYGKIDYLWFDGCGSEKHEFDRPRIIKTIRSLQPDILVFNMWDPDTRWIGNEDGYAPMNNSSVRGDVDFSVRTTEKETLDRSCFLPAECDCKLRDTWFDSADNEDSIKTAEELMGMYEMSVGRGANFLLNVGPNHHGLLNEKDRQRVLEFGALLKKRYGAPLTVFGDMTREGENIWTVCLRPGEAKPLVNRVVIREDVSTGERACAFRVHAQLPGYSGESICVYQGETIGHKAICLFPAIRTGKLTVEIVNAEGAARLRDIRAYFAE